MFDVTVGCKLWRPLVERHATQAERLSSLIWRKLHAQLRSSVLRCTLRYPFTRRLGRLSHCFFGTWLGSAGSVVRSDGTARITSSDDQCSVAILADMKPTRLTGLQWSSNGMDLALSNGDGSLSLWDCRTWCVPTFLKRFARRVHMCGLPGGVVVL